MAEAAEGGKQETRAQEQNGRKHDERLSTKEKWEEQMMSEGPSAGVGHPPERPEEGECVTNEDATAGGGQCARRPEKGSASQSGANREAVAVEEGR